jgi:hypothetical protein
MLKRSYTITKLVSLQGCNDGSTYANKWNTENNRIKDKSHTIISIDAGKSFGLMHYSFIIKNPMKWLIEGTYHNITKVLYLKPIANIVQNKEKLKSFPLKSGIRQSVNSFYSYSIQCLDS